MIQKNEVLTLAENRISFISTRQTAMQEDYLTIAEREMPVNTTEQTWIFEVGEKTRVGRTTPRLVNTLANIIKWLNHLGSGKIDESRLESRQNIHHNFRINGIGL
jgi:hypothetical protein